MRLVFCLCLCLSLAALPARADAPPDPGLTPKTPQELGGDPARIKAYVDSVYTYGLYLYDKEDYAGARKYWAIITTHFAGARDRISQIDGWLAKAKVEEARQKKEAARRAAERAKRDAKRGSETVPETRKQRPLVTDPRDRPGRGDGDGDVVPPPPGDPSEEAEAARRKAAAQRLRALTAKRLKSELEIAGFRKTTATIAGADYARLELDFTLAESPRYLTVVWYARGAKGAIFKATRTYRQPKIKRLHKLSAIYDRAWVARHGALLSARVELRYGLRDRSAIIDFRELGWKASPRGWWQAGQTRWRAALLFYKPDAPGRYDSGTLEETDQETWD